MRTLSLLLTGIWLIVACQSHSPSEPPAKRVVAIDGIIHLGPESVTFTPCGSDGPAWISALPKPEAGWTAVSKHLNSQPVCNLSNIPCQHQSAQVSGLGVFSEDGSYGHLGKYQRAINLIELRLRTAGEICN